MPGWHESTVKFQESGQLKLVGIVQEQHADRANLFMQWKEMDWPLMFDPLNQLNVDVVPITLLVDERGFVRSKNPSLDDLNEFLAKDFKPVSESAMSVELEPDLEKVRRRVRSGSPNDLLADADLLALWGSERDISVAIELYSRFLRGEPNLGAAQFRAGVAFRKRFDSDEREDGDFQAASSHWTRALEINPNQYIWRRRIQQYGPRLQKPYAFFDWVDHARRDVRARGQVPYPLLVEPRGAELATPSTEIVKTNRRNEPDPKGRIFRDRKGYVQSESTIVPAVAERGQAVRVHVEFRPNTELKAHWNNEATGLVFWASPNNNVVIDKQYQLLSSPSAAVSTETRFVELEVEIPNDAPSSVEVDAYALYYVCEEKDGTCLYRRLDVPISIEIE